ncbi:soluble TNF receptor II [Vaccinia virus]|nr:soluble TNF receptor II [Vaccinia virus]QTC35386.1 soluble TNF receptor II [Vaccinia virus]
MDASFATVCGTYLTYLWTTVRMKVTFLSTMSTRSCNTTHNRICECSPDHGCKACVSQTKCGIGYGVSGDVICSPCGLGTYSHTVSSADKCEPVPRNTFNYIDVEINLYPVNDTSCTRTTTTGLSESISTSELTITMNHKDCDPVFLIR